MGKPTQYDLESAWITSEGIPGVSYRYGDIVRVRTGERAGETGEIIALHSIHPEPNYGIVLPPNEKFVWMLQHDLESAGSNSGRTLTLIKPGEKPRTSTPR
jgi:hypothetical protein